MNLVFVIFLLHLFKAWSLWIRLAQFVMPCAHLRLSLWKSTMRRAGSKTPSGSRYRIPLG